jgi:para-aminobenzoate synthetase component 1
VRNSFLYYGINKEELLKALLNISIDIQYISILVSNINEKDSNFPKDYISFDLLAGVGKKDILISNSNSFDNLNKFHKKKKDWLFGCCSYDLKNEIEGLVSKNIDNFAADNLSFFVPEYVLLFNKDRLEIQTYQSKDHCDCFVKSFNFSSLPTSILNINFNRRDDKKSYLKKIDQIKSHIKKGDIYEMNYCQEFYASGIKILPESVFVELNSKMKTPFSSFLKLKEKYILSASPERFLRKKGSNILAQPIKGTRRRGSTKLEDDWLINKLKISQKDISENIMIADLVRNDLSMTARKGSVKVDELCKVYTFKEVHQMITSVSSEIDSESNFTDVLKATFPMGSMTGAPKLRAMKLIEYFEDFKRGFFSGTTGYITPQADFDFNVVIRTILYNLADNYLSIGVGGAITISSDSIEEYEECLVKAKPLFDVFNFKIDD